MNYAEKHGLHVFSGRRNSEWKIMVTAVTLILGFVAAVVMAYLGVHSIVQLLR